MRSAESKTAIILGIIIVAAISGISIGFSFLESDIIEPSSLDTSQVIDKSGFKKAPDLVGISDYINTTQEELEEEIKGKVVLYDIWTYSCINCIRTLPYVTEWSTKYSDQGLVVIGIHSPEFEFEKDVYNVEMAVAKFGIDYPVVLDNEWETWKAFENRYWPRKYIADHEGYIRYDHIGEGQYKETEKVIQELLQERAASLGLAVVASTEPLVDIEEFEHSSFRTPELYFGYEFAQGRNQLGSEEGFGPNRQVTYSEPKHLQLHKFYPMGTWENLEDSMRLISDAGSIKVLYHAKQVNLVSSNNADIEIFLDEKPISPEYAGSDITDGNKIYAKDSGLYNIVSNDEANSHVLEIIVNEPGFEIYTLTFG